MKISKQELLSINYVVDNEYLDKYVSIINNNETTKKEKYKTNCHHIIPRQYFVRNNIPIDNSDKNIVNLSAKDHVLSHYYLALCVLDNYGTGMREAFFKLLNTKLMPSEKELFLKLEKYDEIYNSYITNSEERRLNAYKGWKTRKENGSYMNTGPTSKLQKETTSRLFKGVKKSEEQKQKIKESNRRFRELHPDMFVGKNNSMFGKQHSEKTKRLLSLRQKQIASIGRKWMYSPITGKVSLVKLPDIEKYISNGFIFGRKIK